MYDAHDLFVVQIIDYIRSIFFCEGAIACVQVWCVCICMCMHMCICMCFRVCVYLKIFPVTLKEFLC